MLRLVSVFAYINIKKSTTCGTDWLERIAVVCVCVFICIFFLHFKFLNNFPEAHSGVFGD